MCAGPHKPAGPDPDLSVAGEPEPHDVLFLADPDGEDDQVDRKSHRQGDPGVRYRRPTQYSPISLWKTKFEILEGFRLVTL